MKQTIVIIGGSGLVGSQVWHLLGNKNRSLLIPSHLELDITNPLSIIHYFNQHPPHIVINLAAISDIDKVEKERRNKRGKTWQLNVYGVHHIIRHLPTTSRLIQISTDAVFPGTPEHPGPYSEIDQPDTSGTYINWYGITKIAAEKEAQTIGSRASIIRISHPFGNPTSPRDLLNKTVADIRMGHAIFFDQLFTPTFINDLALVLDKIIKKNAGGIFHAGCTKVVSRFDFAQYIIKKTRLSYTLKKGSMKQFFKRSNATRRTRIGGLSTQRTINDLGVSFHSWGNAIDEIIHLYNFS